MAPAQLDSQGLTVGAPAFWSGTASNRVLTVLAGAVSLMSAIMALRLAWWMGASQLFVGFVLEATSHIRVTVDARGLTVRYGRVGWIHQRIELGRIARASSLELEPMQHGGWGYRGSLTLMSKAAVVVRRGPAIQLELAPSAKRFLVTVDGAPEAARVVNELVAQQSREPNA
jgi:hypothetical protein